MLYNDHANAKQINFSKAKANSTIMFRQRRTKPLKTQHYRSYLWSLLSPPVPIICALEISGLLTCKLLDF